MTKIAYILKMYPRFSETFVVNEILELERQGVDVRIYSLRKPDDGRFHASLAQVKAGVIYVPQYPQMEPERVHQAHRQLFEAAPEAYSQLRAEVDARADEYVLKRFIQAGVVAAHLLEHPVDGIHAHFASSATRVANFVHRLIGLPYSFTAHAKDIFHQDVQPGALRNKIAAARFAVTVSDFNRSYLLDVLAGQPGDVRRLYNGIDLGYFMPDSWTEREPDLILSVGRLVEKKGLDDLIRACALLRAWGVSFRCEIIGKGEARDTLKALIDDLELDDLVNLVGPKSQDKVLEAYRRAALFALPCVIGSDGNRDGLPTVLLEAMATGLPAVSTDLVGVPEIIDHEVDGLLVAPGDYVALATALARLLQDQNLRQRISEAGRRKVAERFDVRRNVATLHRWLAEPAAPRVNESVAVREATTNGANGFTPPLMAPAPLLTEALPAL